MKTNKIFSMEKYKSDIENSPEITDVDSVEKEDVNGNEEKITKPFSPDEIDVDIATVNLGSLIEWLENDEIDLQPDFQRASDVWSATQKSRLIESILLGLPLPSFYFSEDIATKKLSIIDGLQRICAIRDFVLLNKLKLENLQFLKDKFEGCYYSDLERPEIRRIKSLKITVNTLKRSTPIDVKYIIFQRVNTAGVPLEPQEMRNALNQGVAAVFVKELAEMESFKMATNYSVPTRRMQDRDFANRFVAFFLAAEEYNGDLDFFLNEKMGLLNRMNQEDLKRIKIAFDSAMCSCYQIFGNDAFRRRKRAEDKRRQISKSIFDAVSVNIAWLSSQDKEMLIQKADSFKQKMMGLFNNDKFDSAISNATGQKSNVDFRFNEVKRVIKDVLHYD